MSFVSIDLSEVHVLARDIQRNADQVGPKAERIVAAGGHRVVAAIQGEIQRLDLIDTGYMLNSTSVDIDGLGFEAGSEAEYAIYQDQGTSELPASNFHANGFDLELPGIEAALASAGAQILEQG